MQSFMHFLSLHRNGKRVWTVLCERSARSKTFQLVLRFGESSAAEICLAKNGQVSELHALLNKPFSAYIWTSKPLLLFILQIISTYSRRRVMLLCLPRSLSFFFFLCMFHGSAYSLAHSSGEIKTFNVLKH